MLAKYVVVLGYRLVVAVILLISVAVSAAPVAVMAELPYLAKDAPMFNQTIHEFQQSFNLANPKQMIPSYREIKRVSKYNVVFLAGKINDTLYTSAVIDSKTRRIKSLQFTYQPYHHNRSIIDSERRGPLKNAADLARSEAIANEYMLLIINQFNPEAIQEENQQLLTRLHQQAKSKVFYQEIINNVRYVLVDRSEKGITLAVEPIKPDSIKEENS